MNNDSPWQLTEFEKLAKEGWIQDEITQLIDYLNSNSGGILLKRRLQALDSRPSYELTIDGRFLLKIISGKNNPQSTREYIADIFKKEIKELSSIRDENKDDSNLQEQVLKSIIALHLLFDDKRYGEENIDYKENFEKNLKELNEINRKLFGDENNFINKVEDFKIEVPQHLKQEGVSELALLLGFLEKYPSNNPLVSSDDLGLSLSENEFLYLEEAVKKMKLGEPYYKIEKEVSRFKSMIHKYADSELIYDWNEYIKDLQPNSELGGGYSLLKIRDLLEKSKTNLLVKNDVLSQAKQKVIDKISNNELAKKAVVETLNSEYFKDESWVIFNFFKANGLIEGDAIDENNLVGFISNLFLYSQSKLTELENVSHELNEKFKKFDILGVLTNKCDFVSNNNPASLGQNLIFGIGVINGSISKEDLEKLEQYSQRIDGAKIRQGSVKKAIGKFSEPKSNHLDWADSEIDLIINTTDDKKRILDAIFEEKGGVLGKNSLITQSVKDITGKEIKDWQRGAALDRKWARKLISDLKSDYTNVDLEKENKTWVVMRELRNSAKSLINFGLKEGPEVEQDLLLLRLEKISAILLVYDHKKDDSLIKLFNPNEYQLGNNDDSQNKAKKIYEVLEQRIDKVLPKTTISNASSNSISPTWLSI